MSSNDYESRRMQDIVKSYISRLENNNLDINIVLISESHMYEMNPYTKKIRPFNSIIWYDLDSLGEFSELIGFISRAYDELKNSGIIENNNNLSEGEILQYKYGYIDKNTVVYQIEKIKSGLTEESTRHSIRIAGQCDKLSDTIDDLYDTWNMAYKFLINGLDKSDVNKIFGLN